MRAITVFHEGGNSIDTKAMLRFGKVIVMSSGANRHAFEIVACDTSYIVESKKFALWG
jgi:hypothetical protein